MLTLPASEDAFHAATYQLAGELSQRGRQGRVLDRRTAHTSGWFRITRRCPSRGAWAATRHCKALTINAAEILGVADRVGSLEVGKDANLFISKGDPLEVKTVLTNVFINGQDVGARQQAGAVVPEVHRAAVESRSSSRSDLRVGRSRRGHRES